MCDSGFKVPGVLVGFGLDLVLSLRPLSETKLFAEVHWTMNIKHMKRKQAF